MQPRARLRSLSGARMGAQRVLLLVIYLLPALLLSEAAKILTISSLGECLAGESGPACPRLLARSHANSPLNQRGFSYGFPGWTWVLGWRRERLARVVGQREVSTTKVKLLIALEKRSSFLSSLLICSGCASLWVPREPEVLVCF